MDPGYHRRYRLATLCMGPELRDRAERRVSPAAGAPIRPEGERNGLVAGKGPALSVGQGRIAADSASAGSNPAPLANVRASNKRYPPCCRGKGRKPGRGEFPCSGTFSSAGADCSYPWVGCASGSRRARAARGSAPSDCGAVSPRSRCCRCSPSLRTTNRQAVAPWASWLVELLEGRRRRKATPS